MPVGGIKEKLIGALRAGVRTVLLPSSNRKDVKDLPQEVKDGLDIVHVRYVPWIHIVPLVPLNLGLLSPTDASNSHIWEALRYVWPDVHWPGEHELPGFHSRL